MKVTIEILTHELRRLLDVTSHDTNLHHVPVEALVAEAAKRGIAGWEFHAKARSYPEDGPLKDLVDTCVILVRGWEDRDLRNPPPDFGHILNAVRKLRHSGYRL